MPPETSDLPPAMPPRHFTLIVLLCGFLALALDVVALVSPAWVTSKHFSLSLWEICNKQMDAWFCRSVLHSGKTCFLGSKEAAYRVWCFFFDWQMASLVLVFCATLICGVWFIVCVLWICQVKQPLRFCSMSLLLLASVLLQISALILFSLKFRAAKFLLPDSQFSWGYGLAWGSCIFMLGGVVISCLRTDVTKD